MLTILHASDLHFGKHFDPEALDAYLAVLESTEPNLLVFSGDFTQRAKASQFAQAAEFLAALPDVPRVVVPGNHGASYLMHKVLGLPGIAGEAMPAAADWPIDRHCATPDRGLRKLAAWIDGLPEGR